jgi:hypothetical protein
MIIAHFTVEPAEYIIFPTDTRRYPEGNRAMSTELYLDFVGIMMDSRKVEGNKGVLEQLTSTPLQAASASSSLLPSRDFPPRAVQPA